VTQDNAPEERAGGMPSRSRYGPLEVVVGERGVEAAIRLFKRVVLRDGILQTLKRRSHYESPGNAGAGRSGGDAAAPQAGAAGARPRNTGWNDNDGKGGNRPSRHWAQHTGKREYDGNAAVCRKLAI